MLMPLAKVWGTWIHWWQVVLLLVLVVLIVAWKKYRSKQI